MPPTFSILNGGIYCDSRGALKHCNPFDMAQVRRFYLIAPINTEQIRGWQAHQVEQKWFYCNRGAIRILLVQVSDWENPKFTDPIHAVVLQASEMQVLHVPGGYATAFKAEMPDTELFVFSDMSLEDSSNDDFRYHLDVWPFE